MMRARAAVSVVLLWTLPAVAGDPTSVRAEVEAALGAMSRAVLAADADEFLKHISKDDSLFATEQRHWAEQLKDYKPAEFSLSIGTGESSFEAEESRFPLVMSWLITTGPAESWGAGGKPRTVNFPTVTFVRRDGQWLYQGETWKKIVGKEGGFEVWFQPGEKAEAVAMDVLKAFPVARDHDNEFFDVKPPPQVLKLFTSMDHLKATVYLNMPDSYLGGWSEPGESIKFMTSYASGVPSWTNAYAHEYGHVCTWTLGPHASDMPWWMQEGAAELAAEKFRPGQWPRLDAGTRKQAAAGSLPPWDQISDYITTPQKYKMLAYTQGEPPPRLCDPQVGRRQAQRVAARYRC